MPIQAPQWTEFLSCPICFNIFDEREHKPISLACGHTVCRLCLSKLVPKKCPFDQNVIFRAIEELPVNFALLQLVGVAVPEEKKYNDRLEENVEYYNSARTCIEELAMYLKPVSKESSGNASTILTRPMQRKLVTLVNCQLIEDEGRCRAVRAARSLGERTVTELILQHQNPQQLSANLWAGVRARGCQFLGPAMQEEVLKLILLALEDGSALSRKVLVLFVVQRLEAQYPQASKTAIGHVVQLLYRASCFKVTKREEESSLMQLKEDLRTYDSLRREHDSQIVQIATEAGLRISPEQWSSLLYGDTAHKSHMQSIIDKLQTPQSFSQSITELTMALQRTGDPGGLIQLNLYLDLLASIDPGPEIMSPTWESVDMAMRAIKAVVEGLVDFSNSRTIKKQDLQPLHNPKYKTSMCRDLTMKGKCPRGTSCTFAHSQDEMDKYRQRSKKSPQITRELTPNSLLMAPSNMLQGQELALDSEGLSYMTAAVKPEAKTEIRGIISDLSPKSCCSDNDVVNIPIVKPCSLPTNTKAKMESSIYSSSMLNLERNEFDPNMIVTLTRRVSSMKQDSEYRQLSQSPPPSPLMFPGRDGTGDSPFMSGFQQPGGLAYNTAAMSNLQAYQPWAAAAAAAQSGIKSAGNGSSASSSTAVTHATASAGDYSQPPPSATGITANDEMLMRQQMMMPPNPYTIDRYGLNARDTAYYNSIVIRSRGKSPSKQLEELQNRKKELLSQLHKTKTSTEVSTFTSTTGTTSVVMTTGVTPSLTPDSGGGKTINGSRQEDKESKTGISLAKSVADSRATTLATMTLANSIVPNDDEEEGLYGSEEYSDNMKDSVVNYADNRQYSAWSCADEDQAYDLTKTNEWPDWKAISSRQQILDNNDEYLPLSEESEVSKYGPISRMIKTKIIQTAPVQVTAGQHRGTTPVTAITPVQRPHPITSQIPSVYNNNTPQSTKFSQLSKITPPQSAEPPPDHSATQVEALPFASTRATDNTALVAAVNFADEDGSGGLQQQQQQQASEEKSATQQAKQDYTPGDHGDHKPDPNGIFVAASLPTALMQPNVIATANRNREAQPLWTLNKKLIDPNQRAVASTPNVIGREKLQNDIANITNKIQHLQSSEDDRLVRELKAIELNIEEATRQVERVPKVEQQEQENKTPPFVPSMTDGSIQSPSWQPTYQQQQPTQYVNQPDYNQLQQPQPSHTPQPQQSMTYHQGQMTGQTLVYPHNTQLQHPNAHQEQPQQPQPQLQIQITHPPPLPLTPTVGGFNQVGPQSSLHMQQVNQEIGGMQNHQYQQQQQQQVFMAAAADSHHIQMQAQQQQHQQQQQHSMVVQSGMTQSGYQLQGQMAMPGYQQLDLHQHQQYVGYVGQPVHSPTYQQFTPTGPMAVQSGRIAYTNTVQSAVNAKDAMDFQLAREAQLLAMSQQQAKIEQESKDRKYAEDIALQEVERFVRASIAEDE